MNLFHFVSYSIKVLTLLSFNTNHLLYSAPEKIRAMGQVLSKAREEVYDCRAITQRLRAMLQSADEQVRSLKKQSTFLSQLAAKTIPNSIHCLSMRLTIDYYLLPLEKRKFPRSENLENPSLYHYALFSDNVLAASVVVNSTIMNAKVICMSFYSIVPPLHLKEETITSCLCVTNHIGGF